MNLINYINIILLIISLIIILIFNYYAYINKKIGGATKDSIILLLNNKWEADEYYSYSKSPFFKLNNILTKYFVNDINNIDDYGNAKINYHSDSKLNLIDNNYPSKPTLQYLLDDLETFIKDTPTKVDKLLIRDCSYDLQFRDLFDINMHVGDGCRRSEYNLYGYAKKFLDDYFVILNKEKSITNNIMNYFVNYKIYDEVLKKLAIFNV